MTVQVYSDGGSRGNPGSAAAGAVVMQGKRVLVEASEFLGTQTNNYAEYRALILGLKRARDLGATDVECFMDSLLVAKQMSREYKVKHPEIQKLFVEAWNAALAFKRVTFTHVPRARNAHADRLVNRELDKLRP